VGRYLPKNIIEGIMQAARRRVEDTGFFPERRAREALYSKARAAAEKRLGLDKPLRDLSKRVCAWQELHKQERAALAEIEAFFKNSLLQAALGRECIYHLWDVQGGKPLPLAKNSPLQQAIDEEVCKQIGPGVKEALEVLHEDLCFCADVAVARKLLSQFEDVLVKRVERWEKIAKAESKE